MTHGEVRDEGPASRLRRERARLLAELTARSAELSARGLSLVRPNRPVSRMIPQDRRARREPDLILKHRRPGELA